MSALLCDGRAMDIPVARCLDFLHSSDATYGNIYNPSASSAVDRARPRPSDPEARAVAHGLLLLFFQKWINIQQQRQHDRNSGCGDGTVPDFHSFIRTCSFPDTRGLQRLAAVEMGRNNRYRILDSLQQEARKDCHLTPGIYRGDVNVIKSSNMNGNKGTNDIFNSLIAVAAIQEQKCLEFLSLRKNSMSSPG